MASREESKQAAINYGWYSVIEKNMHIRDILDDVWEMGYRFAIEENTQRKENG